MKQSKLETAKGKRFYSSIVFAVGGLVSFSLFVAMFQELNGSTF